MGDCLNSLWTAGFMNSSDSSFNYSSTSQLVPLVSEQLARKGEGDA